MKQREEHTTMHHSPVRTLFVPSSIHAIARVQQDRATTPATTATTAACPKGRTKDSTKTLSVGYVVLSMTFIDALLPSSVLHPGSFPLPAPKCALETAQMNAIEAYPPL